jgi:hypothetical protein
MCLFTCLFILEFRCVVSKLVSLTCFTEWLKWAEVRAGLAKAVYYLQILFVTKHYEDFLLLVPYKQNRSCCGGLCRT